MDSFWRFLRDMRYHQVLGWLGGGLVVTATGLWVALAFVYLFPPLKSPETKALEPASFNGRADCSGVTMGGNVTGAIITTGATINSDCCEAQDLNFLSEAEVVQLLDESDCIRTN